MKCLECGALIDAIDADSNGIVTCVCGVQYSDSLLDTVKPEAWESVRTKRAFRRHGKSLVFFTNELYE